MRIKYELKKFEKLESREICKTTYLSMQLIERLHLKISLNIDGFNASVFSLNLFQRKLSNQVSIIVIHLKLEKF